MATNRNRISAALILLSASTMLSSQTAYTMGECGLSCCLGSAAGGSASLASNFGLTLQYETSSMVTIRDGSTAITPDEAISKNWTMGNSYAVPTDMQMKKVTLTGAVPINDRLVAMALVPYVINDMEMRMKNGMGMVMNHTMDTIKGFGDITLMGLYTLYSDAPVRPNHRLTVGLGLKLPTGKNDSTTSSGNLVHAMMQAGSGSWDPLFTATYVRAFYPLILQANLFVHAATQGDMGYQFGTQATFELSSAYQVHDYANVTLGFTGITTGQDEDADGNYSRASSMVDSTANTGLRSLLATAGVQGKIPGTGGSLELKYQRPVMQKVRGLQQVLDSRLLTSLTWNF